MAAETVLEHPPVREVATVVEVMAGEMEVVVMVEATEVAERGAREVAEGGGDWCRRRRRWW